MRGLVLYRTLVSIVFTLSGMSVPATLPSSCKTLLQFVLSLLPECGDAYLSIFKFVNSFCTGEAFLSSSDTAFLVQQLKSSRFEEEAEEKTKKDGQEAGKGVCGRGDIGGSCKHG